MHRKKPSRTLLLSLLTWANMAIPAIAQDVVTVRVPQEGGSTLTAFVMRPAGAAALPAIIALHGCGGPLTRNGKQLSSRHLEWGSILVDAGYVVIFPDSFGSRGHRALCTVQPRPVKHADRLRDVETARRWLEAQPFVDRTRLHVLGWSNGGSTALRLAASKRADHYRRIVAFYPGCRAMLGKPRQGKAPLKIIMGAADNWTPAPPCQELAVEWKAPIVLYEGAYHGFDAPASKIRKRKGLAFTPDGSGTAYVGTHPEARKKAIAEVLATLAD